MPQLFYGLLLTILCWLIGVAVASRLIDILFRVAMVVILCPVFIAMAAFPLTREKYSKKAVTFFLSALV
jgi:lipopolysaccharide/colanic/teichoic acid biosynthesis glycosyltransferase